MFPNQRLTPTISAGISVSDSYNNRLWGRHSSTPDLELMVQNFKYTRSLCDVEPWKSGVHREIDPGPECQTDDQIRGTLPIYVPFASSTYVLYNRLDQELAEHSLAYVTTCTYLCAFTKLL